MQLALAQPHIGVWDWDVTENTMQLSPKAKKLLGHDVLPKRLRFDFLERIIHPNDRERFDRRLQDFMHKGAAFEIEYRIITFGRETRWLYNTAEGVWDDENKIQRVVGSFTDITRRKEAEEKVAHYNESLEAEVSERTEKLNVLVEKLQRSNADLERFAMVASHDLREPIRTIVSFAQLLEKKYGKEIDTKGKELVQHIISGANRMEHLVANLLDFAKLGSPAANFEQVNLNDIVAHVSTLLQGSIELLNVEIKHSTLPTIYGDRAQLSQLFQNLISNAIKYHKKGKQVQVDITHTLKNNEHVIAVTDNGIGIPAKHHQEVFEPFKRLHSDEKYSGVGIGLSACLRVVENHHGRIWIDNEYKQGTRVYVALPLSVD